METIENNKLIAEFMGLETTLTHKGIKEYYKIEYNSGNWYEHNDLQYHSSWDWLIPVIEKIEGFNEYDVEILQYGTRVLKNTVEIITNVADFSFDKKIEHCYDAIVKFIKEYNKQH